MPRSTQDKKAPQGANHDLHLKHYQAGLRFMQEGKYEKARTEFEKLLPDAPPAIRDRAVLHLTTCERQSQTIQLSFASVEERYDFAVLQLNSGNFEEAREHLDLILAQKEDADYAHYGAALLCSITGQAEECLTHLARAIELNPLNRLQARRDTDFTDMADDPRFTELLYPEIY